MTAIATVLDMGRGLQPMFEHEGRDHMALLTRFMGWRAPNAYLYPAGNGLCADRYASKFYGLNAGQRAPATVELVFN